MGCGLVDGAEEVFLTGVVRAAASETVHDQIERAGAPRLLLETFPGRIEYARARGTPTACSRTCSAATCRSARSRRCSPSTSLDVRLVDNGITRRRSPELIVDEVHIYHLIPRAAGKGRAVATHMRRRGLAPDEVIAIGDSRGDLEVADVVGPLLPGRRTRSTRTRQLRAGSRAAPNVTVTEEPMTAGFYEAIVRSLAER